MAASPLSTQLKRTFRNALQLFPEFEEWIQWTVDIAADAAGVSLHAASHQDGGTDEIATATPGADAIPKADGSSKLDTWISPTSATVAGLVELATQAEVDTGTDTVRAVTPETLTGRAASETLTGLVELATQAEVDTGTDTVRAVTAATLTGRAASETLTGLVELATQAEVDTGTDTGRAVTPATLAGTAGRYALSFGANLANTTNFARGNGAADAVEVAAANELSQLGAPMAGALKALAWRSAAAAADTVIKIFVNGVLAETKTLSGANGSVSDLTAAVALGQPIHIEFDAGTAPGNSTWTLSIE